ncbi:MAG: GTPase ObgE, partial [Burkholderiales bacterium]
LGHQFLRHLMRTKLLLHLVDIAPLDPEADPVKEVRAIAAELKKFDPSLAKKIRWLVFTKTDLLEPAEAKKRVADCVRRLRWTKPVFAISAVSGVGCKELTFAVQKHLQGVRDTEHKAETARASKKAPLKAVASDHDERAAQIK